MGYDSKAFKKFITGQNLFNSIIITIGVIVPCLILNHYHLLLHAFAFPIGYIFASQSDVAGPIEVRKKHLFNCIVLYVSIIIISGLSRLVPGLIFIELIVFSFLLSMMSLFGNRGQTAGILALIVFTFNIDNNFTGPNFWYGAGLYLAGSLLYVVIFFVFYKFRPYLYIQQLIGENLIDISNYLEQKTMLYKKNPNYDAIYGNLMSTQIKVKDGQNTLRESIFETRKLVKESTSKSRAIMLIFLDSVELFERLMTTQQNYKVLHQFEDQSEIIDQFGVTLEKIANTIGNIGISMQAGFPDQTDYKLNDSYLDCKNVYNDTRNETVNASNIGDFFTLKQILFSIRDIVDRINEIQRLSQISLGAKIKDSKLDQFSVELIKREKENYKKIFVNNLSLQSSAFRHALRVTIALVISYLISFILPIGHAYWILMTTVIIMKPAYSLSKQLNMYRIIGTFIGIIIGILAALFISNTTVLFILMTLAMIVAYSTLKINYLIATVGVTTYIMICFYFLAPAAFPIIIKDRLIDTSIASVISILISNFVFPSWEKQSTNIVVIKMLASNNTYFKAATQILTGDSDNKKTLDAASKQAFIDLANLSDNFQKMLSEPKRKRLPSLLYHQFSSTSHLLTSYIASLSYYAQTLGSEFTQDKEIFSRYCTLIDINFNRNIQLIENKPLEKIEHQLTALPENEYLNSLIIKNKVAIEKGDVDSSLDNENLISPLQMIQSLFDGVFKLTLDQSVILAEINAKMHQ